MSILDYGAGASEGLDQLLQRMLREEAMGQSQQRIGEERRSNLANEALKSRQLDEGDILRQSLAEQRQSTIDAAQRAAEAEKRQMQNEDVLLKDPNTPANISSFIKLRRSVPKGETIPSELFKSGQDYNAQRETGTIRDPAMAQQLGVKPGEPIDVDYNPRTLKKMFRGQDVTNVLEHWDKPPTPDRVLIQSGEGYVPRAEAARTLAGGGQVPLATTTSTRTMSEGAKMLTGTIPVIANDAAQLDKVGLFGPLMSRVRAIATKLGTVQGLSSEDLDEQQRALTSIGNAISSDPSLATDRMAGKFATELGLLASGAGRVHGGARGGGSIQMIEYLKSLLSGESTLPLFLGRLDALKMYMDKYAAGPGGQQPETGGLPQVGGMFQGGKVLSVTPVKP